MVAGDGALHLQRKQFVLFWTLVKQAHPVRACRAGARSMLAKLDSWWPWDPSTGPCPCPPHTPPFVLVHFTACFEDMHFKYTHSTWAMIEHGVMFWPGPDLKIKRSNLPPLVLHRVHISKLMTIVFRKLLGRAFVVVLLLWHSSDLGCFQLQLLCFWGSCPSISCQLSIGHVENMLVQIPLSICRDGKLDQFLGS
jgi:hypothetical protein